MFAQLTERRKRSYPFAMLSGPPDLSICPAAATRPTIPKKNPNR
jgi:hypothetical protein